MKHIFNVVVLLVVGIGLAGCAGTSMVTAPTQSSSAVAPVAQKDAVLGWASACETWDNAKQAAAEALLNGIMPPVDAPKAVVIDNSISPLCLSFPSDPALAATEILTGVANLSSLTPAKPINKVVTAPTTSAK